MCAQVIYQGSDPGKPRRKTQKTMKGKTARKEAISKSLEVTSDWFCSRAVECELCLRVVLTKTREVGFYS